MCVYIYTYLGQGGMYKIHKILYVLGVSQTSPSTPAWFELPIWYGKFFLLDLPKFIFMIIYLFIIDASFFPLSTEIFVLTYVIATDVIFLFYDLKKVKRRNIV